MTAPAPLPTRRLNPAEVLFALRDFFVRVAACAPDEVDARVRPATPLADLSGFCADLDFAEVFNYLGVWPLPRPDWWEERFTATSTVADLCVELSELIRVPAVEPAVVLGRPCRSAGAFLTVRRLLANAGADVSGVAPSIPLYPYLWLWPGVFDRVVARMAPGRVPPLVFRNPKLGRRIIGLFLSGVGSVCAYFVQDKAPAVAAGVLAVSLKVGLYDLVLLPLAARRRNWSVEFGGLYDFRDLIDCMLDRPSRRPVAA